MTTDLRDVYIGVLIDHVREGNLGPELLDRIERLLDVDPMRVMVGIDFGAPRDHAAIAVFDQESRQLIEPQAPVVAPDSDTATPEPAHEAAQGGGEVAERPARPATAEQPVAPPASSPDPPRRSTLIGRVPVTTGPTPTAIGTPKPEYFCIKGCGRKVSGPDRRCQKCAGADRRASHSNTRHKGDGLQSSGAERAIAIPPSVISDPQNNPQLVNVKRDEAADLPPCACPRNWWLPQNREENERKPSDKHSHLCPLHRHRWSLPPAAGLDGQVHVMKCPCGATKDYEPAEKMYGGKPVPAQHTAAVTA